MKRYFIVALLCAACTDSNSKPIGSACVADSPSASVCGAFPKYFCDSDHPNGYCKAACKTNPDCPSGSVCAGAGVSKPGECHKICAQASRAADCRVSEGYVCKATPDDSSGDYCDVPEAMPSSGDGGSDGG